MSRFGKLGMVVAGLVMLSALSVAALGRFTDDDGNVHEQAIEIIAEAGITKGCDPEDPLKYCPSQVVTRDQMAAFLGRGLDLPPSPTDFFTDDDGSTLEDDINRIAAAGITLGCAPNRFCPSDPVTRDQMASFLVRALDLEAGAVFVAAGESIQAAVDAAPAGATFVLGSGIHRRQSIAPKHGQTFIGEDGAILDGEGVTEDGIAATTANDVTITNLTIRDYTDKCIEDGLGGGGYRWLVENNDIGYCDIGIRIKMDGVVRGNYIHHNRRYGLTGAVANDLLIEDNEFAYNRTNQSWASDESGTMKIADSDGVVFRNNWVHHNYGHGIYFDVRNTNTLIENNISEYNDKVGIFYEISDTATIRNNTVTGNGRNTSGIQGAGAGILVYSSRNTSITNNHVTGNIHGIVGKHSDRGTNQNTGLPYQLRDLHVAGNTVEINHPDGYTGLLDLTGNLESLPWNNTFTNNTYTIDPTTTPFIWGTNLTNLTTWQTIHPNDG